MNNFTIILEPVSESRESIKNTIRIGHYIHISSRKEEEHRLNWRRSNILTCCASTCSTTCNSITLSLNGTLAIFHNSQKFSSLAFIQVSDFIYVKYLLMSLMNGSRLNPTIWRLCHSTCLPRTPFNLTKQGSIGNYSNILIHFSGLWIIIYNQIGDFKIFVVCCSKSTFDLIYYHHNKHRECNHGYSYLEIYTSGP